MSRLVDISLLSPTLQEQVCRELDEVRKQGSILLTIPQAATLFGYTEGTLRKMCHRRELDTVLTPQGHRLTPRAISAYIAGKRKTGRPVKYP